MLTITEHWKSRYPGAHIGVLVMNNVANPAICPSLEEKKRELTLLLRQRFAREGKEAIRKLAVMKGYKAYYKPFKQTYHVQQQIESIALKGKSIPGVAALVEAMFMAEMENMLLTAGHDLDVLMPPIRIDVAEGQEVYTRINGEEQILKADDMYIADAAGVISAIIYGPDQRTQITSGTRNVLYTVYAPQGISAPYVENHLVALREYIHIITPEAHTTELTVYSA